YVPGCSVTCELSWNCASPYTPGGSVVVPPFVTVIGFAALHANDGNDGMLESSGVVNEFGPEFCGTTSEPPTSLFEYTSNTLHRCVMRIVSAFTCEPESIVTESFAQMLRMGLLLSGVLSMPPAPTSPPVMMPRPGDSAPLKF